jgi:hypothetical protein
VAIFFVLWAAPGFVQMAVDVGIEKRPAYFATQKASLP